MLAAKRKCTRCHKPGHSRRNCREGTTDIDTFEEARLRDETVWRKVKGPQTWRPQPGDEIVGHYVGRTLRSGQFGQYEVVMVSVPRRGVHIVSGCKVLQLIDSARVLEGDLVRIAFMGVQELDENRTMKLFEVYVEDSPKN